MHMQQVVSITSQGQITIPATFRRLLQLDIYPKATVELQHQELIIKPIPDLLNLAGSLHSKALKNKSLDQIIKLENQAIATENEKVHRRH